MLYNHLLIALRSLSKHLHFNLLHIGGLAIGLTAAILVLHYASLEHAYDEFHKQSDRIYRVSTLRTRAGQPTTQMAATFSAVAPALKAQFAEVENATRIFQRWRGGIISYEETRFRESNIFHVDSGFFKVFDFPLLSGRPEDLFNPGTAFIEEKTALKYFGEDDPIGKRISFGSFDGVEEYEIRGVVRCPENSSLKFTFLFSYNDLGRIFGTQHESNWLWLDFHTFIVLKEATNSIAFESKLTSLLKKNMGDRSSNISLKLQHFPSIYLESKTEFETGITGNKTLVNMLLALGVIILAIVALNFINLSTSHSLSRLREVGIRKVLGSTRRNLVFQFMIEMGLINLIALLICIGLIAMSLPYFNQLTQREIEMSSFLQTDFWMYALAFFAVWTLAISLYPSSLLSSAKEVEVLKGSFLPKSNGAVLREVFVGFQAMVSFSLVVAILIVLDQLHYVNKKELGIDLSRTLVVRTPDVAQEGYISSLQAYKTTLLEDSRIASVTTTVDSPGSDISWLGGTSKLGDDNHESHVFFRAVIDEDFIDALGGNIISGKQFAVNQSNRDILINQIAASKLQFNTPDESIGQRLIVGRDTFSIIGVVADFHQVSPREEIVPTIYHFNLEPPRLFLIKYDEGSSKEIIELAGNKFNEIFPGAPFDYYFLDDYYNQQYDTERRLTVIIISFCILAIIVSSLGLLGLTWFRLALKKKELAIRKVIGSTNWQLFGNASKRMIGTTLIGCLLGIPAVWFIMNQWLQTFAYHTYPKPWEFSIGLGTSLVITLLSISGHTLKVITGNPVNHLRQE